MNINSNTNTTTTVQPTTTTTTKMPQTATIGFEQLSKYFHLPINDVAKELGICATMLKKICRRNGIPRWPHRKIKSLNKMIENLEQSLQNNPSEAEDCIKQEISILKSKKILIMKNPSILASSAQKRTNAIMGEHADAAKPVKKIVKNETNNSNNNEIPQNTQPQQAQQPQQTQQMQPQQQIQQPQHQQMMQQPIQPIHQHHHQSSPLSTPSSSISTPPSQNDINSLNSSNNGFKSNSIYQQISMQQQHPQHHQHHQQQMHSQHIHHQPQMPQHPQQQQQQQQMQQPTNFSINQLLTPNNPFAVTPLTSYLLEDEEQQAISQQQTQHQQDQPQYITTSGHGIPYQSHSSPSQNMPQTRCVDDIQSTQTWYTSNPQQQMNNSNGGTISYISTSQPAPMFSQVMSSPEFGFTLPKINNLVEGQQQMMGPPQNQQSPPQPQYITTTSMAPQQQYQQQPHQQQQYHQSQQMTHQHQQQYHPQQHHQQQYHQQHQMQQQMQPQQSKVIYVPKNSGYGIPSNQTIISPPNSSLRWVMEHEKPQGSRKM